MGADNHERRARQRTGWKAHIESKTQLQGADLPSSWRSTSMKTHSLPRTLGFRGFASHQLGSSSLTLGLPVDTALGRVQYVSVIAWVFDFRKFITITDVSLQAMYIACAPIASICSQHGLTHERYTKYLVPWGVE